MNEDRIPTRRASRSRWPLVVFFVLNMYILGYYTLSRVRMSQLEKTNCGELYYLTPRFDEDGSPLRSWELGNACFAVLFYPCNRVDAALGAGARAPLGYEFYGLKNR